jgi:hypothetical protein
MKVRKVLIRRRKVVPRKQALLVILPVVCLFKILSKLIILRARINKTAGAEEAEEAKEMQEAEEVEQADVVVVEQAGAEIERQKRWPNWGTNVRQRSGRIFR